jgi:hypothetical protein
MLQGWKQHFDISASVHYPKGRGRMLRYRVGSRADYHTPLRGKVRAVIAIFSALMLHPHYHKAASMTLELPLDVTDELPAELRPEAQTFWSLGDQPLDVVLIRHDVGRQFEIRQS